jgi:hypothetical protein
LMDASSGFFAARRRVADEPDPRAGNGIIMPGSAPVAMASAVVEGVADKERERAFCEHP